MAKSPVPKKKPAAKRISPAERERVEILFRRFESLDLHPKTELNYSNPYELVTAVALSAQATDVQVNKATGRYYRQKQGCHIYERYTSIPLHVGTPW